MKIGDMVQCGVYVMSEYRPTYKGRIVADRSGYYEVDIASHCGCAPWIVSYTYGEVRPIDTSEAKP